MKEIYNWVPAFRELAKKIADEGEGYLIEKIKQVEWDSKSPSLLTQSEESKNPFSFFYFLARQTGTGKNRRVVCPSIEKEFELQNKFPDVAKKEFFVFPHPPFRANVLFPVYDKPEDGGSNPWWAFFRQVAGDELAMESPSFIEHFKQALAAKDVRVAKLTQTLFLINPRYFLPIDNTLLNFDEIPGFSAREAKKAVKKGGWGAYKNVMEKIRARFLGCSLYEINMLLYFFSKLKKKGGKIGKSFFQISSNVYDDRKDKWSDFEENYWVYTGGPGEGGFPEDGSDVSEPERETYPLRTPELGDIVLVRYGTKGGKAIGVVYENDYKKGLNKNSRLHVLWMNKGPEIRLQGTTDRRGFAKARLSKETYNAFAETDAYSPTLDFINGVAHGVVKPNHKTGGGDVQNGSLNRILYGPPGTGKTWISTYHALSIVESRSIGDLQGEDRDNIKRRFGELRKTGQIEMITFHQGFSYEDFIEGIRPVLSSDRRGDLEYELHPGIFKRISKLAGENPDKNYVLIIDEINRGNIAKIFGELITLIESSKRCDEENEARATLPYSNESFCVPKNLYLIGTMNTADRSIALLDTALRRRFEFVEMMPKYEDISTDCNGVNCQKLLRTINEYVTALLDRDHQIGHTYFLGVDDIEKLKTTFQKRIIPLLQEYFYDNWEKIDLVLNKNKFISDTDTPSRVGDKEKIYELLDFNHARWSNPGSYKRIYEENQSDTEEEELGP